MLAGSASWLQPLLLLLLLLLLLHRAALRPNWPAGSIKLLQGDPERGAVAAGTSIIGSCLCTAAPCARVWWSQALLGMPSRLHDACGACL